MKILIVEDNKTKRSMMKNILVEKGHEVTEAENGARGLEAALSNQFDLIVSDILMPEMDGFKFLRAVKKEDKLKRIPFVFYSFVFTGHLEQKLAYSLGAEAFIVPSSINDFYSELSVIIDAVKLQEEMTIRDLYPEEEEFLRKYGTVVAIKLEKKVKDLEKATESLKTTRERLSHLLSQTPAVIYSCETEYPFAVTFISENTVNLTGYTVNEYMEDPGFLADHIHPDDKEAVFANLTIFASSKSKMDYNHEYRFLHKDGRYRYLYDELKVVVNESGKPVRIIGFCIDITTRKEAEAALKNSEEKLRTVIENASDAICVITDDKMTVINPSQLQIITGYTQKEIEKAPFNNFIHPDDREAVYNRHKRRIAGEDVPPTNSFRIVTKSGDTRWAESTAVLTEWDNKKANLVFLSDITAAKEAELKVMQSIVKLRQALEGTIKTLTFTAETRDPYTAGHQRRVADLARAIAQGMGLSENEVDGIRMAGRVHDLGKIGIPSEILSKPGKLSNIEFELIKSHPRAGYEILKGVEFPWPVADIVLQHHERINGTGYPGKLKGTEILSEARILAVADVVEAMASHRPYREALGLNAGIAEIKKNRGVLYDEKAVDACLKVIEKGFKFE